MARPVSGRNVQDFFTNPCFDVMGERIAAMKDQFTAELRQAISNGEMDLAKNCNGKIDCTEKIVMMLKDLEQGLRLQAQKKAKEIQP